MLRTYKLSPTRTRQTPLLELIRRRAAELEREAAEGRGRERDHAAPHPFSATH